MQAIIQYYFDLYGIEVHAPVLVLSALTISTFIMRYAVKHYDNTTIVLFFPRFPLNTLTNVYSCSKLYDFIPRLFQNIFATDATLLRVFAVKLFNLNIKN